MTLYIFCTINAQSLVAHAKDIKTDTTLMKSDVLVMTETWMSDSEPVNIEGFELVAGRNQSTVSESEGHETARARRAAGGVAIYRRLTSNLNCSPMEIQITDRHQVQDSRVGDISLIEVFLNQQKFILGAVYIHPGVSQQNLAMVCTML